MLNHNDIRHKLSDYIDGATSDSEKAGIEEHLKTCAACSEALAELRKTVAYVKEIEEVESPAWMTGKIMARVREEAEAKKSFFPRLFSPLRLPVQTAAVLFLAVTAYYLYQNINPAGRYAETPTEVASKEDAPSTVGEAAREKKTIQAPAPRTRKVEQEPGYKSLDMKYEYEKPAPPVPRGEAAPSFAPAPPAAPAPAKPEGQPGLGDYAARKKSLAEAPAGGTAATADGPGAPAVTQEQAGRRVDDLAKGRAAAAAPMADFGQKAAAEKPGRIRYSLSVDDVDRAAADVARIIEQLRGKAIRRDAVAGGQVITLALDAGKTDELKKALNRLGALKEQEASSDRHRERVQIEITIVKAPARP